MSKDKAAIFVIDQLVHDSEFNNAMETVQAEISAVTMEMNTEYGKIFSDTFGTHKVLKVSSSQSSARQKTNSNSIQQMREPIIFPEDFGDLENEMVIYFKGKYCRCVKINCYTDK